MNLENVKIQICDDSILARKQLKDFLSSRGCKNIVESKDGPHTVEVYQNEKPNLVFMDIVMPEFDGVEAVRQILQLDPGAQIIMLSSVGTHGQIKAAIEAGAKDFIQKPFQEKQVLEILSRQLG